MLQEEQIYKNQMLSEIGTACQQGKGKIPWFYCTNYFFGRSTVFGCLNVINKLLLGSVLSWLIILTSVLCLKMGLLQNMISKVKRWLCYVHHCRSSVMLLSNIYLP